MGKAIVLFFKNYVNFSGRSTRSEYWWPILLNYIIAVSLNIALWMILVAAAASGSMDQFAPELPAGALVLLFVIMIYNLAVFIPILSVTIRRFHDIGKSGWWIFISLVPCIGGILSLIFMCTDSQPGANQWGPNPKETQFTNSMQNY